MVNVQARVYGLEKAMAFKELKVLPCEEAARKNARRSLVASCLIGEGELLTSDNLTAKRPGTGTSPVYDQDFLGKKVNRNFKKDEFINREDLA